MIFAVISGDKQNWRFQVVVTACCRDADSLQRLSFRHRELAAVWLVCCVSTDRYEEGDMMICDTDSCFTHTMSGRRLRKDHKGGCLRSDPGFLSRSSDVGVFVSF